MFQKIDRVIWARRIIFWGALAGLFAASYLLYTYSSGAELKCGPLSGCDVVRASKWSSLFGIPTPAFGVFFYVCVLSISLFRVYVPDQRLKMGRGLMMLFAWAGFLESFYLTLIQRFALNTFCFWCLVSAAAATGIFVFVWLDKPKELNRTQTDREMMVYFISLLLGAAAGLIGFYILLKPAPVKTMDLNLDQGAPGKFILPEGQATSSMGEVPVLSDEPVNQQQDPADQEEFYSVLDNQTPVEGPMTAKVTVVEFMDFECPACGVYHKLVINPIREKYRGKIRFAVRHMPLTQIHPRALDASVAAVCAQRQNKFFPYYDLLFDNQKALSKQDLIGYALQLGLNQADFEKCLEDKQALDQVQRDYRAGMWFGVIGTPTLIINDALIDGTPNLDSLSKLIEERL
ncbi:MAG TPA: thioredoxin domain-containing protein [bacterium]|nr:MAG: Disulfide bond formation protein D precursor [Parcubacteria group bacterium ADurb.Bin192]HPN15241.1 thioredoxin domain-containing protein [bacterium]